MVKQQRNMNKITVTMNCLFTQTALHTIGSFMSLNTSLRYNSMKK